LSGLIAAFAGALLSVHERRVEAQSFGLDISLNLFIMVVLGGLGGISGAVAGAIVGAGLLYVAPDLAPLVTGVGAFGILLLSPGGLSQAAFSARDAVLRLVALRKGIDVPTLIGAGGRLAAGLWWLAPPPRERPSLVSHAARRYSLPSFLWGPAASEARGGDAVLTPVPRDGGAAQEMR
ncbi:MAG: hypothetical protein ABR564_05615, partial [Candidatus Dormibacteria bacterium]